MKTSKWFGMAFFLCLLSFAACAMAADTGSVSGRVSPLVEEGSGVSRIRSADGRPGIGIAFNGGKSGQKPLKVQLIDRNIDMKELVPQEIKDWYEDGKAPAGRNIFLAQTDGKGMYRMENIPAGEYFLVFVLPDDLDAVILSADYKALRDYLPEWDYFQMAVVGVGDCDAVKVKVQAGKEVVANYIYGAPLPVSVSVK